MTSRQLLRFVMTRPPLSHGDRPHLIPGPFDTIPGTVFQQAIDRADTDESVVATAREFLSSERYVGARLRTDNGKGVLSALPQLITQSRRGDGTQLHAALQALAQRWPYASAAGLGILWDSYLAATLLPKPPSQDVADLTDGLRISEAIARTAMADIASVVAALMATPVLPAWLVPEPKPGSPADRGIRPAGVADLLLIEERLVGYEHGELCHVENVLRSEKRERVFRKLDRTFDSYTLSTEQTEQTERDLQSTTRSDLQSEVSQTATKDASLTAGVGISASYGPFVDVDTSVEASLGTSNETASNISSSYAQDIVDRSVTTISSRVRETIVQRTLAETEETNVHGFDNTQGVTDVVGYYRWLEQIWQAQVMNYGRRMLIEITVPEPAALWRAARASGATAKLTRELPSPFTIDPFALSATNYDDWAAMYGAEGVTPPPAETLSVNKTFEIPELEHKAKGLDKDDYVVMTKSGFVDLPPGYVATYAYGVESKEDWGTGNEQLRVTVANKVLSFYGNDREVSLSNVTGPIEIVVYSYDVRASTVGVRILCARTDEAYQAWQLATHEKIAAAYQTQLDAYLAELAAVTGNESVTRADLSPDAKRRVEQIELKRAALNLITAKDFSTYNALSGPTSSAPIPVIDVEEALDEGRQVRFFESVLEWVNLCYVFYPYFWGRQETWYPALIETDPDPTFESFLQAGSARVQIPVRPGFEKALLYYLYTGKIWKGGEAPLINDNFYLPIVEELAEATGMSLDEAVPYGKPWTYRMPTTLVAIDADVSDLGL